jgi:hypothetical protein
MPHQSRVGSFEQDLLWKWRAEIGTSTRQRHGKLCNNKPDGRLRTYRGLESFEPVDLTVVSLNDVSQDFELFVEPTDFVRNDTSEAGTRA